MPKNLQLYRSDNEVQQKWGSNELDDSSLVKRINQVNHKEKKYTNRFLGNKTKLTILCNIIAKVILSMPVNPRLLRPIVISYWFEMDI